MSEKFNIKISWDRIKVIPPVDPGQGIDHGYIKTLGKYKHGNRVLIKFIYRLQEGFYFNFFFEAFYRIIILSEEDVLLDIQKNFNTAISPSWSHVIKVAEQIPAYLRKHLNSVKN